MSSILKSDSDRLETMTMYVAPRVVTNNAFEDFTASLLRGIGKIVQRAIN